MAYSSRGRYSSYGSGYGGWAPYVSVAERRKKALAHAQSLNKKGQTTLPISIKGRTIAATFWGKSWCVNLESYRDFENRLERGRRYVRNGSVIDLKILPGKITSLVSGSSIYKIEIDIKPLDQKLWLEVQKNCTGEVLSVLDLLQGKLSDQVMKVVTSQETGLFPKPKEISFKCSCPDSASMCKHIAATLYGVGHRLDSAPELLFTLRKVDHHQLISKVAKVSALTGGKKTTARKTVAPSSLSQVFGIEMDDEVPKAKQPARISKKTVTKKKATTKLVKKATKVTKARKVTKAKVGPKKTPKPTR